MFPESDPNALIERAFDIQGGRIAYEEKGTSEGKVFTVSICH